MANRILICDSDKEIRLALKMLLEHYGYDVSLVDASSKAVTAAVEFDALLIELALPGLDGIDVVLELRRCGILTPVIMMSARGSITSAIEAVKAGAVDFLEKPLESARVLDTLKDVLSTHALPLPDRPTTEFWTPSSTRPGWLALSPSAMLLATDLLNSGRRLSDLTPRQFEELIGQLLEGDGWRVVVTRPSRDGGVDVVASRDEPEIGIVRSVWQAKKYGRSNHVSLGQVRELSGVVDSERVTKGMIVTTSRLSRDAIAWVRRDQYRLGYKDRAQVERWVLDRVIGKDR
jgi:DNA-binding response OmpR family regulator